MNTKALLRFILQFLVYILIIAGLAAYPLYKKASPVVIEGSIANTVLFFFLTIVSFALVLRANGRKGGNVLNAFMMTIGIKMFVSLIYFMIFLSDYKGHELEFALTFFAAYLVCTGFEVYYLLSNLRQI